MDEFVTVSQAAKLKQLSTGYVRQLCIDGKLTGAQKMGNQWIIPRDTIEKYKPAPRGFAVVWERKKSEKAAFDELRRSLVLQSTEGE